MGAARARAAPLPINSSRIGYLVDALERGYHCQRDSIKAHLSPRPE